MKYIKLILLISLGYIGSATVHAEPIEASSEPELYIGISHSIMAPTKAFKEGEKVCVIAYKTVSTFTIIKPQTYYAEGGVSYLAPTMSNYDEKNKFLHHLSIVKRGECKKVTLGNSSNGDEKLIPKNLRSSFIKLIDKKTNHKSAMQKFRVHQKVIGQNHFAQVNVSLTLDDNEKLESWESKHGESAPSIVYYNKDLYSFLSPVRASYLNFELPNLSLEATSVQNGDLLRMLVSFSKENELYIFVTGEGLESYEYQIIKLDSNHPKSAQVVASFADGV